MTVYEALMVALGFSSLIIALVALFVHMQSMNKK
ncbi:MULTISPECIES: putative holin-like toxin [Bacillaceae]|nr:putative holin-like toxin [Cytobacillus sp. IB215316]MDX8362976.1 putative holin-like toxin [Cytobacillus sp. IB215316]